MKKCIQYLKGMQLIGLAILTICASFFKVNFIIGSQLAHFSATSVIIPLIGLFSGVIGCWMFFMMKIALGIIYNPFGSLHILAFYVPGFCASLYLASSHVLIRLILPIVCMLLFFAHPVGYASFAYALYWLIPIGLHFLRKKSFFLQALGSTFTAHAVGSVIWLYTVPMSSVLWLGLIPIVLVERLLFASGITLTYLVFSKLINKIKSFYLLRRNTIAVRSL